MDLIRGTASLYRGTWAEVDLDAITFNVKSVKQHVGPRVEVMAVVKANGYGHGAVPVAKAAIAAGATWLGVATLGEALELRQSGITVPVLVLGYVSPDAANVAMAQNITLTVASVAHAEGLARSVAAVDGAESAVSVGRGGYVGQPTDAALLAGRSPGALSLAGHSLNVHIKLDSGMTRIGVRNPEEVRAAIAALATNSVIHVTGLFTHFAQSDGKDLTHARRQLRATLEMFDAAKRALADLAKAGDGAKAGDRGVNDRDRLMLHAANSGAIMQLPESHFDMVRLGISLYGVAPSLYLHAKPVVPLRQALKLYSQIVMVKEVPAGTAIGYGGTFVTSRPTRVATVPIGYGDGLARLLSNRGSFLVRGQSCPIVGRVCMDQTMIDMSAVPGVREGDTVVVYDDRLLLESAELAGTIPYEPLCAIAPRVPREYVGSAGELVVDRDHHRTVGTAYSVL
ncbi:alanine racemase [Alicyclobacillus sp. ALC3]|uniref:alanine racemase n=1 Tax=Alicyclobacillus sp. ALC3 TaxID=2796143 RepID=UPI00237871BC|nr:alanine racemase [Alicyclobacillus sp. ALC3]WDL95370.1 alanine racemase [Alicyclobacillus sp. ALC3]